MQTDKQRDFANQGDTISRHGVYAWLCNMGHEHLADAIMDENRFPSAQPDHSGDVNGKVDLIDRQAVIDALTHKWDGMVTSVFDVVNSLPSAHPEIIRCKECKHWKKTCGDESWSVGDCDFFDEKLVMCKGFCAWAERRTDETTI